MEERLKELMQELGNAINESLSESERISSAIEEIKVAGYEVFLVLEATIGFNKRDEDAEAPESEDADTPAIKVRDGGMLTDPRVVDWMARTAEKAHLPYQLEILEYGTTDARAMQVSRAGIPVGCLSIPCRYIHSPSEMVDYGDVQNAVRLMAALLSGPIDLG